MVMESLVRQCGVEAPFHVRELQLSKGNGLSAFPIFKISRRNSTRIGGICRARCSIWQSPSLSGNRSSNSFRNHADSCCSRTPRAGKEQPCGGRQTRSLQSIRRLLENVSKSETRFRLGDEPGLADIALPPAARLWLSRDTVASWATSSRERTFWWAWWSELRGLARHLCLGCTRSVESKGLNGDRRLRGYDSLLAGATLAACRRLGAIAEMDPTTDAEAAVVHSLLSAGLGPAAVVRAEGGPGICSSCPAARTTLCAERRWQHLKGQQHGVHAAMYRLQQVAGDDGTAVLCWLPISLRELYLQRPVKALGYPFPCCFADAVDMR
jgi:hypothetical protein